MKSTLWHAISTEGAALYRTIREWRLGWQKDLQEAVGTVPPLPAHEDSQGSGRLSSPLHAYYPFLFHTPFEEVPIETVRELALADRLYTEHLLAYDRTLDTRHPAPSSDWLVAQLEHMQSLKRLYTLFAVGDPFWGFFYDCCFETWKAVAEENLNHSYRIGAYPITRFLALARGKTAVLKPFSLALAFLAKKTEALDRLSRSLDQHHIALVLIDDLEDWKQDFQRSTFTFLLTRLVQRAGLAEEIQGGPAVSPERIGSLLYGTGLAERQLRLAEVFFQKAVDTVDGLPLPLWRCFNDGFQSRCRALRFDLAEIRRREERCAQVRGRIKGSPGPPAVETVSGLAQQQVRAGLHFLEGAQAPEGAFPLSASPHAYMHPSRSLAASRCVTSLVTRSLEAVQSIDSCAKRLRDGASCWLAERNGIGPNQRLPSALEGAFVPMPTSLRHLARLDFFFAPAHGPLPDGLFWANFHYTCFRRSFTPPRLTAFVADCLLRGDYTAWSRGVSFGPVESPWTRHRCRPLLPLLLLCQASGPTLPRKPLQDYLLESYREKEWWNNTTETCLTLLCLLLTGYDGPELPPALDKLSASQEADGSWAPNAVYKEEEVFYGSRELTTAWCVEVLFRYHLQATEDSKPNRTAGASA